MRCNFWSHVEIRTTGSLREMGCCGKSNVCLEIRIYDLYLTCKRLSLHLRPGQ